VPPVRIALGFGGVTRSQGEACRRDEGGGVHAGVRVYANLYGDTLGPSGSPGATYIGMERSNVQNVVTGLLGHAPNAGRC
jgi:hypothetical protein